MKTAMQFLKDEIKSKIIPSIRENGELNDYQHGHNVAYETGLTIIEYLLEKEKEQLIEAHLNGQSDHHFSFESKTSEAEQYYYDRYNQSIKKITITELNQNK